MTIAIYGIQVGEYSDYRVIGYCNSEDSAMRRCALLNRDRESVFDEYTYFKLDDLDCADPVDVWFVASAMFSRNDHSKTGWRMWYAGTGKLYPVVGLRPIVVEKNSSTQYKVTACVRKNSDDLAMKTLEDIFYKHLAEQEGVV